MSIIRMSQHSSSKRAAFAYVVTAFAALGAALYTALGVSPSLTGGAAAYVNGSPIPQPEYARALKAMQAGLERPLTADDRASALSRLIDEELIVQEAIKLGYPSSDRLVRKNLVQSMMRSVTSLEAGEEISEQEIRAFFDDTRNLFASPKRVSLQVAISPDAKRSLEFVTLLQTGAAFPEAIGKAGLEHNILPEKLPIGKVGSLIGGGAAEMAAKMEVGVIAGPVASGDKELFLWMTDMSGGQAAFEEVRGSVKTELERRRDEAALDNYLARLRKRARIKQSPTGS